jgi:hypothetical protein
VSASPRTGWITTAQGVSYPPAPWHLGGILHASVWRVPIAELPATFPPGVRPSLWFGRATLLTAWVLYEPGSVLDYHELMAVVRVRLNGRTLNTVTHIWVDDISSLAGGRELWGIPKRLATFHSSDGSRFEAVAEANGERIASLRFTPSRALPGWWRFPMRIAQHLDGRVRVAEVQSLSRLQCGRANWDFAMAGPLGFLAGRRPLFSVRLSKMAVSFGICRNA